eukprot:9782147-Prorocentrum_lima.AAC.1
MPGRRQQGRQPRRFSAMAQVQSTTSRNEWAYTLPLRLLRLALEIPELFREGGGGQHHQGPISNRWLLGGG